MVGSSPCVPKSSLRLDEPAAEELLPDAVDRHARGERVVRRRPASAPARAGCGISVVAHRRQHRGRAGVHALARRRETRRARGRRRRPLVGRTAPASRAPRRSQASRSSSRWRRSRRAIGREPGLAPRYSACTVCSCSGDALVRRDVEQALVFARMPTRRSGVGAGGRRQPEASDRLADVAAVERQRHAQAGRASTSSGLLQGRTRLAWQPLVVPVASMAQPVGSSSERDGAVC